MEMLHKTYWQIFRIYISVQNCTAKAYRYIQKGKVLHKVIGSPQQQYLVNYVQWPYIYKMYCFSFFSLFLMLAVRLYMKHKTDKVNLYIGKCAQSSTHFLFVTDSFPCISNVHIFNRDILCLNCTLLDNFVFSLLRV